MQTGASALRNLVLGTMTFVPGYVVLLVVAVAFIEAPGFYEMWVMSAVGGAVLLAYGMRGLSLAYRDRPTDLVISTQGARLDGGPYQISYGNVVPWAELTNDGWRVREMGDTQELVTGPVDNEIVLAHATDMDEIRSLEAIAEVVRVTGLHRTRRAPATSGVASFACPGCGAPVVPDDTDVVTCAHCQRAVPMRQDTRERIRAARRLGASARVTPELVGRILDQPSARTVNAVGLVATLVGFAAWPGAIGFGGWLYANGRLGTASVLGLLVLAPTSIWLTYAVASAIIVNRRALQLVGLRLSSTTDAAGRVQCRLCGGALDPRGALVVACGFCGAPNMLGLDLRSEARDAIAEEEELRELIGFNADRRASARTHVAITVACAGLAVLLLLVGLSR